MTFKKYFGAVRPGNIYRFSHLSIWSDQKEIKLFSINFNQKLPFLIFPYITSLEMTVAMLLERPAVGKEGEKRTCITQCLLFRHYIYCIRASLVKNSPAKAGDTSLVPGSDDFLEKEMTTHSGILAWKSHGQESLAGHSPCSCKRAGHDLETKQQ